MFKNKLTDREEEYNILKKIEKYNGLKNSDSKISSFVSHMI